MAKWLNNIIRLFVRSAKPRMDIIINRPSARFQCLTAFQKQGLYFVHPKTGEYIKGLISLPYVGLTFTPPPACDNHKNNLGFIPSSTPPLVKEKTQEDGKDTFEIDALLYFEYKGPECTTGFVEKEIYYLYFLKIWNDVDLKLWEEIAANVIRDTCMNLEGQKIPLLRFVISTTFVPNDRTIESKMTVEKRPDYPSSVYAVSNDVYDDEEYYYEDDRQQRSARPRP